MPVETRCTWKARTSSSSNRSGDRPKYRLNFETALMDRCVAGDRLRTVMSSIMRRRRGLKSAISILLSEGGGLQHPHPLSQEAIYATLPLTPRAAASFNLEGSVRSRSREGAASAYNATSLKPD